MIKASTCQAPETCRCALGSDNSHFTIRRSDKRIDTHPCVSFNRAAFNPRGRAGMAGLTDMRRLRQRKQVETELPARLQKAGDDSERSPPPA